MSILDLAAFDATPLQTDPYDFLVVPDAMRSDALPALAADFPRIEDAGTYPIERLQYGPAFEELWKEVQGAAFRSAIERKFGVDLTDHPIMATVRERCQASDGAIHTDSKTKVITVLLYFNEDWPHEGGRLRILRSADDLASFAAEVEPRAGTLLAFRRSERSFHGHLPFEGHRRMMQIHWVDPKRIDRNERKRRTLRWRVKKALRLG
jgi:SM-20-related protein